jgi:hypothetical protein
VPVTELSRREFTEAVALAALAPLVAAGAAPLPVAPAIPGSGAAAGAATSDPRTLAQALAAAVRAQYGGRLSEADLAVVTRQIEGVLERAEKIRRVQLANADEPDFVFRAVRSQAIG